MSTVAALPETDSPAYFGLPDNIDQSLQRSQSRDLIGRLRVLKRADLAAHKFDRDAWTKELSPILNLWRKLNTV